MVVSWWIVEFFCAVTRYRIICGLDYTSKLICLLLFIELFHRISSLSCITLCQRIYIRLIML